MNPPAQALSGPQRFWALKSLELPLDDIDEADEQTLNQILWHSVKGYDTPYRAWQRCARQGVNGHPPNADAVLGFCASSLETPAAVRLAPQRPTSPGRGQSNPDRRYEREGWLVSRSPSQRSRITFPLPSVLAFLRS